jgi:hypothetical protein
MMELNINTGNPIKASHDILENVNQSNPTFFEKRRNNTNLN